MRTIIAGSRTVLDYRRMSTAMIEAADAIEGSIIPTVVLCGMAIGADMLGYDWAKNRNLVIERYPADWRKHGKAAGFVRNEIMVEHADALVALWDGKSRGTQHVIGQAERRGLRVYIYEVAQ